MWKDISTAPLDGRVILGAWLGDTPDAVVIYPVGHVCYRNGDWKEVQSPMGYCTGVDKPTHWTDMIEPTLSHSEGQADG